MIEKIPADLHFSFLTEERFPQIHATFVEAFADYELDMSYMTRERMHNRAVKNGVDYTLSVGVFDGSRLVGITLIGVDRWRGEPAAFDATTGIVPRYRGKGIARRMFEFALPELRRRGIRKFVLEVLQSNEPAVKVYRKTGFTIVREFDCFSLGCGDFDPPVGDHWPIDVVVSRRDALTQIEDEADWPPSWENSFSAIRRIPDEVVTYAARGETGMIGILIYYPALKWILTLVVRKEYRRRGVATRLLSRLVEDMPREAFPIEIVNVNRGDAGMIKYLKRCGFRVIARQYEMAFNIC